MIHLVYKTEEQRKNIEDLLNDTNRLIYNEDAPDKVKNNCNLVSYYSYDEKLQKKIDNPIDYLYDDANIQYFRMYDINTPEHKEEVLKTLVSFVTFYNSSVDGMEPVGIFNSSLIRKKVSDIFGIERDRFILDDMTDLALLAFSNGYDVQKNNDLIISFLYDGNNLKNKYEEIMGEGSFRKFDEEATAVEINYAIGEGSIYEMGFDYVMSSIKTYFYKKMDTLDIPLDEKNAMIIRFNDEYNKVYTSKIKHLENKHKKR